MRIEDLASEGNADPLLVSRCSKEYVHLNRMLTVLARIMRLLAGLEIFKEVGKGLYTSTDLASAFVTESAPTAGLIHIFVPQAPLS